MNKLNLTVKLIGEDGNIFNLMRIVTAEMRKNGHSEHVDEFRKQITSSRSYDEALCAIMDWVEVR
jgi:hypothetical protein